MASEERQDSGASEVEQSTSEVATPASKKTAPAKKKGAEEKKTAPTKKKGRAHKCAVCGKFYQKVRRHIISAHINKNEKLPLFRLEALVQMSIHWDDTRGAARTGKAGETIKEYRGRKKEICPICDRVQQYLTTHLQKVHKLDKRTEKYKEVLEMARFYEGKRKEIKWDVSQCSSKRHNREDSDLEPDGNARPNAALVLLGEDLPSDTSASDYEEQTTQMIPPSPRPSTSSFGGPSLKRKYQEEETRSMTKPSSEGEVDQDSGEESEEGSSSQDSQWESSDEEEETWKEHYRKGKASGVFDTMLVFFYDHVKSISGGGCKGRQAINYCQNVRTIKGKIDKDSDTIDCFTENGGSDVMHKWVQPNLDENTVRPGTVKSYLTSLVKFLLFVKDHANIGVKGFPKVPKKSVDNIPDIVQRMKHWSTVVNKKCEPEWWEKILEDQEKMLTKEEAGKILQTEPAKEAVRCLQSSKEESLTLQQFTLVRDYLIVRLGLENAQRPGPLEAARLRDFNRAEDNGTGYVMCVARHKTAKGGPALLGMDRTLYKKLKAFIEHVRPKFANQGEEALFTTQEGKAFEPGTIGKRVTAFWEKALGKRVTSTDIRKMAASTLHDAAPVEKRKVHSHMCHREDTRRAVLHDWGQIAGGRGEPRHH